MLLRMISGFLSGLVAAFDDRITSYVQSFTSDGVTPAAIVITNLGSAPVELLVLTIVSAVLFFRLRHGLEAMMLIVSLAGGWLLNEGLKRIFHRARPAIEHLVEAGGYSFPSGHAMVSMAFYGMIGYLLWSNLRTRLKPAYYVILLTALLVIAIGTSRINLGVHYPSDVVAGFAAGGTWLIVCIMVLLAGRRYREKSVRRRNRR